MEAELDLGALGFWLFLAAVVLGITIAEAMKEQSLHRLIQASIEKTGAIDPLLAELLEKEIGRKAEKDARMWGVGGVGAFVRKVVSVVVATVGAVLGIFAFVGILIRASGPPDAAQLAGSDLDRITVVLVAIGVSAAVAAFAGLMAWLVWPKSKKLNDSEPLV